MSEPNDGLIERAEEVAAVEDALAAGAAGTGCALVVSGQAGVGKSALVHHAEDIARGRGSRCCGRTRRRCRAPWRTAWSGTG